MQTLGDNIHVLGCIEALQDECFLYIIMPYCVSGSLVEWIPWVQGGVSEDQAKTIFSQLLENVRYLQARSISICHRDLSPDNCMIYLGRVVFTDLAMSFRIPNGNLVRPLGGFGKPAYLPPEVYMNFPFDAHACDLWSAVVVLFNLLTGEILYELPHPEDLLFRYFVLARGVSRTPMNERTYEILMDTGETAEQTALCKMTQKCMDLSPEVLELLESVLKVAPQERWTTEQVNGCPWMTK
jgi:serine/threonine protein kinase